MIRAASLLLLAGCASQPAQAPPPTVTLPPTDLATIKALLQPCQIEPATKYSSAEAIRVANARRDALIQCNKDKAAALSKLEKP